MSKWKGPEGFNTPDDSGVSGTTTPADFSPRAQTDPLTKEIFPFTYMNGHEKDKNHNHLLGELQKYIEVHFLYPLICSLNIENPLELTQELVIYALESEKIKSPSITVHSLAALFSEFFSHPARKLMIDPQDIPAFCENLAKESLLSSEDEKTKQEKADAILIDYILDTTYKANINLLLIHTKQALFAEYPQDKRELTNHAIFSRFLIENLDTNAIIKHNFAWGGSKKKTAFFQGSNPNDLIP